MCCQSSASPGSDSSTASIGDLYPASPSCSSRYSAAVAHPAEDSLEEKSSFCRPKNSGLRTCTIAVTNRDIHWHQVQGGCGNQKRKSFPDSGESSGFDRLWCP